jgi:DNA-binding NarL/FixJ family response regulator
MLPRTGGLIRVLLVDDNPNVIATTRLILLTSQDIEVVGDAGDGEKSLEAVQRLRPDVVVMDGRMPRMDGAEATRRILRKFPETRVVALSIGDDNELIRRMERAGARQTVLKGAGPEELSRAIRTVVNGFSPERGDE